jgi:hypothetical protein
MDNEPEAVDDRLLIIKGNVRRAFLLPLAILSLFLSENLGALAECPYDVLVLYKVVHVHGLLGGEEGLTVDER